MTCRYLKQLKILFDFSCSEAVQFINAYGCIESHSKCIGLFIFVLTYRKDWKF